MNLEKMLVVYDPTTDAQPALERALHIAEHEGNEIHLFSCIDTSWVYNPFSYALITCEVGLSCIF